MKVVGAFLCSMVATMGRSRRYRGKRRFTVGCACTTGSRDIAVLIGSTLNRFGVVGAVEGPVGGLIRGLEINEIGYGYGQQGRICCSRVTKSGKVEKYPTNDAFCWRIGQPAQQANRRCFQSDKVLGLLTRAA